MSYRYINFDLAFLPFFGWRVSQPGEQKFLRHAAALHKHRQIAAFLLVDRQRHVFSLDEIAQPADRIVGFNLLKKDIAHLVVDHLHGNRTRAAEVLGISRTTLWRLLKDDDR